MENHDVMIGVRYSSISNGEALNGKYKKKREKKRKKKHLIRNKQKETLCKSETWLEGDYKAYAEQMYRRFCVNICSIFRLHSHHIQISAGTEIPYSCYIMRENTHSSNFFESRASCKLHPQCDEKCGIENEEEKERGRPIRRK